ncbi:MAG TPA: cell division protein FtsL [Hyphomonadaceae bacterium]|nr:cell division protein FtsL [Hyphomonadaceae bacterium]
MKRLMIIGGVVVAVLAFAVYRAKLGAEATESHIATLQDDKKKVDQEIAVLKAEEAFLTRPERIGPIARDKLGLEPAKPQQFTAPEALQRRLGEERLTLPDPEPVATTPAAAKPSKSPAKPAEPVKPAQ